MSLRDESVIADIRERALAATPGPWYWHGEHKLQELDLCHWDRSGSALGRCVVMAFRRWGTQRAQPEFVADGYLTPAADLPIFDVDRSALVEERDRLYRHTIVGVRHPDAEFIAHARQDVDVLLARIDELEQVISESRVARLEVQP